MVKLRGEPVDIMVIVVYMPTTNYLDEDMEEMQENIKDIFNLGKGND